MVPAETHSIQFSLEELQQFSAISCDRNPLHLSADYARKTPYGDQVVFGVLGVVKCLLFLNDRHGFSLSSLSIDFRGPLLIGTPYKLFVNDQQPQKADLKVYDGSRLLLKVTVQFGSYSIDAAHFNTLASTDEQISQEAEYHDPSSFTAGQERIGTYTPNVQLDALPFLWSDLQSKGISPFHLSTLLCSTYLIGMKLPGQQALFSKLKLRYSAQQQHPEASAQLDYSLKLQTFDPRFQLLRLDARYTDTNHQLLAEGELQAFVRPILTAVTSDLLSSYLPASDRLAGKVALVTGASRGLGAMLAQSLASQGCQTLVNYHRSSDEAQAVAAQFPEHISLIQGDASDLAWCMATQQFIAEQYGRLDYLICNACPPILPLKFEAETVDRINTFIGKSIALVNRPMSAFLKMIVEANGWNIVISSIYTVQDAPTELSHYISAKCAVEGLLKAVAMENDEVHSLLVRPPKLLTDQTNTPLGREGSIPTVEIAAQFINCLLAPTPAKGLNILEF